MEVERQLEFPYWEPVLRRFEPDSLFFASGNIERELLAKQVAIDLTEDENHYVFGFMDQDCEQILCPIAGCDVRLTSLDDFEDHYNARHRASCSVCSRAYPTYRLLSIHISEAHDSFFRAKVARGYDMYECLVESCGLKFKNYKSRHQHLVDKHKFPNSFDFSKKAHSSKKQRHKQQRKQSSHKKSDTSSMEIENEDAIDRLVSGVSKLTTSDSSPSSVSFGRRHARGLTFVPRALQQDKGCNKTPKPKYNAGRRSNKTPKPNYCIQTPSNPYNRGSTSAQSCPPSPLIHLSPSHSETYPTYLYVIFFFFFNEI